ncbi:MAG TPA: FAD-dependent oxidoreductase [Atribacteraceae bacterium]|nr:FAD-dependent oxidoreductase [Atribacteraceae bacterium]
MKSYDLIIVGGGVVGCALAWYFSRFDLAVLLLEKESDLCCGVSKANSGVMHSRSYWTPESLKGAMHLRSLERLEQAITECDLMVRRCGALTVALEKAEVDYLRLIEERGQYPDSEILGPQETLMIEPNVNPALYAAYLDPHVAVISPFHLTIGLAETARLNGVDLQFGEQVEGFENDRSQIRLKTPNRVYKTSYVVTAGGFGAPDLIQGTGDSLAPLLPVRGEYYLLDRECDGFVNRVLYPVPGEKSKGILVCPTPEGNVLAGPNFEFLDRETVVTTHRGLREVAAGARRLAPGIPLEQTIHLFAGVRPTLPDRDFYIFFSTQYSRVLHIAGAESPGLTAAFGIAEYVGDLLQTRGLNQREKTRFVRRRAFPVFRETDWATRDRLISQDPDWGKIVCRCEEVTLAEVKHILLHSPGCATLDSLKKRIRVTAGRCQGSFCLMNLPRILSEVRGLKPLELLKSGPDSRFLLLETKEREKTYAG